MTDGGRIVGRGGVEVAGVVLVGAEGLYVVDESHDATGKDEDEGYDAQSSDDVQPNEHI